MSKGSLTISELLGAGSYGTVHSATDGTGRRLAVKKMYGDKNGVPCPLEVSIMNTLSHPNLNGAIGVYYDKRSLQILQERAESDLYQKVNKKSIDLSLARKWCHGIAQAVKVLHHQMIIHADIKAGNILYFGDDDIRLTDFTLSVIKWREGDMFRQVAGTATHCPLECLEKRPWDESLDIWELGCTFYHIIFGQLLFPRQMGIGKDKSKYINCILEWDKLGYVPETCDRKPSGAYTGPVISPSMDDPKYQLATDLICKMLVVEQSKRITIDQVLNHPFFKGLVKKGYRYHNPKKALLNSRQTSRFSEVGNEIVIKSCREIVTDLALIIYRRYISSSLRSSRLVIYTSFWIAHKMVTGTTPSLIKGISLSQVLEKEAFVCNLLSFRLHPPILQKDVRKSLQ